MNKKFHITSIKNYINISKNIIQFSFSVPGLFLNCDGTTSTSLRSILENITSPIHTLSIYDFDRSVTSLSQDVFQAVGINIRILTFTHSHLETLKDNSLRNLRASLESLSIANGKLVQVRYFSMEVGNKNLNIKEHFLLT